jgi:hypothetical protein
MRFLEMLANPALRYELAVCQAALADVTARSVAKDGVIDEQADLIRQFRAEVGKLPDYEPRLCYCPLSRWRAWLDGARAGPDGVVHTADDDWLPERAP